jgi:hypothetical protein
VAAGATGFPSGAGAAGVSGTVVGAAGSSGELTLASPTLTSGEPMFWAASQEGQTVLFGSSVSNCPWQLTQVLTILLHLLPLKKILRFL